MSATFKATEHRMATWYDTLRDLLPALHGFEPTVRLYAGDYPWCSLNAASEHHRQAFVGLMNH